MKILLLSDTHGYMDERILSFADTVDEVWHAGDMGRAESIAALRTIRPFRAVYGNIDGTTIRHDFPLDNRFELEGVDVWMTHIGGYPGRYEPRVRQVLMNHPPKLFICGHSHILKVQFDPKYKVLCMNPGAAGNAGFHKVRTMLRFELAAGDIKNLEVIELGPRSAKAID
jgi:uncharacterized protein